MACAACAPAANVPGEGTDGGTRLNESHTMPRVIYIHPNGERDEVDVANGQNLMLAATANDLNGIVGDCGGVMSCATCHVIVEAPYVEQLPPPSETENQMLDYTAAAREQGSRLSCQIVMNAALDGMVVRIADPQL